MNYGVLLHSKAGLELVILRPQNPECWDYRHVPPHTASAILFDKGCSVLSSWKGKEPNFPQCLCCSLEGLHNPVLLSTNSQCIKTDPVTPVSVTGLALSWWFSCLSLVRVGVTGVCPPHLAEVLLMSDPILTSGNPLCVFVSLSVCANVQMHTQRDICLHVYFVLIAFIIPRA